MPTLPWFEMASVYARTLRRVGWKGRIRGVGYLLRQTKSPRILGVDGMSLYFNPRVAGAYDGALIGKFGEAETHQFINAVLDALPAEQHVRVIDVGANIGEFSLDLARRQNVSVIAIEPQAECARVCRVSAALNGLEHKISVHQIAVSSAPGSVRFAANPTSPQASAIVHEESNGHANGRAAAALGELIPATTVDLLTADVNEPCLIKIDVEGAELEVLRGATDLLRRQRPLIVFEFNALGQSRYSLDDLRAVIGSDYTVYRLRGDGRIDRDLTATWNCVAVSSQSIFASGVLGQLAPGA